MKSSLLICSALSLLALSTVAAGAALPGAGPFDDPTAGRIWHVDTSNPASSDQGEATSKAPFKSISRAAALAQPGDTVRVHPGVYREWVRPFRGGSPGKPILYESVTPQGAIVTGADPWQPEWTPVNGSPLLFQANLDPALFAYGNPFAIEARSDKGRRSIGQLFLNDIRLLQVDTLASLALVQDAWHVNDEGSQLTLHWNPARGSLKNAVFDLVTRPQAFAPQPRELTHIIVRGFVFQRVANQFPSGFWVAEGAPQAGAVSCRSGRHWTIEHNLIREANTLGLDCGGEGAIGEVDWGPYRDTAGHHLIRHNIIENNGALGIAGAGAQGIHIIGNIVRGNNAHGWFSPEIGGMKFHYFTGGLIEGNLVTGNNGWGIWLDNVYRDSRVTRNLVVNNRQAGIFLEMGHGPILVDNNVVLLNNGPGVYAHDASGITLAHNLFGKNAHFGIFSRLVSDRQPQRADGSRSLTESSRNHIVGNLFFSNVKGHLALPFVSERSRDNSSDHNLFINGRKWAWLEMGRHRFYQVNNDGRIPLAEIQTQLEDHYAAADTPAEQRLNPTLWAQDPVLDPTLWEALTGHDRHSFFAQISEGEIENGALERGIMDVPMLGHYLYLADLSLLDQPAVPSVPGVDRDYHGNPYPKDQARPGPFQKLPGDGGEPRTRRFPYFIPTWRVALNNSDYESTQR